MIVNAVAVFHPNTRTVRINSYRNKVSNLVKTALKNNKRISIITSQKHNIKGSKCNRFQEYNKYADYDTQINNMFDELTNEIVSDIETCACDYPETYISIVTTKENADLNLKSETYLIHCPE